MSRKLLVSIRSLRRRQLERKSRPESALRNTTDVEYWDLSRLLSPVHLPLSPPPPLLLSQVSSRTESSGGPPVGRQLRSWGLMHGGDGWWSGPADGDVPREINPSPPAHSEGPCDFNYAPPKSIGTREKVRNAVPLIIYKQRRRIFLFFLNFL